MTRMNQADLGGLAGRWARTLSIGALALAPLGLTIWILWLLVQLAAFVGGLFAKPILAFLSKAAPELEDFLSDPVISGAIALAVAIAVLTLVGLFAGNFIGRQFGRLIAAIVERIPVARVIYSSARQLIDSFQSPAAAGQKVVLIEFPTETMRTVGLVTRTFRAEDTGQELAAVYVPTTPNPTSGYVEIVPVERLVWLDWTPSEAIQFVVSAGVVAPETIRFKPAPPEESGKA
ncbi:MAG: DUF502 domain-containing protein [Parvularculaceae bacterium]